MSVAALLVLQRRTGGAMAGALLASSAASSATTKAPFRSSLSQQRAILYSSSCALPAMRGFTSRSSPSRAAGSAQQDYVHERQDHNQGKAGSGAGEETSTHITQHGTVADAEAETWSVVARMQLRDVLERTNLRYESRPRPAGDKDGATNAQGAREATRYWMCSPSENVEEVLKRMIDANITAQLVVDNDKVVGTLTDRDYIAKVVLGRGANNSRQQPEPVPDALGDGPTPHVSTRSMVADVMTPAATSADVELIGSPDTRVLQALRVMGEKGIRMLPVMEGQKLLGFLTYFDLVDATVTESSDEIERLVCYIGGHDYAVGCQRQGTAEGSPDAYRPVS